jgi:hypothetical protein
MTLLNILLSYMVVSMVAATVTYIFISRRQTPEERHRLRWEKFKAENPISTRYDLKIEEWEAEENEPYWGEGCLDDEEYDARWDWEYLERARRERSEGVKRRPILTGEELRFAEELDGYRDLAKRSYTAAELHEVIVNCLRSADEEDVRRFIPKVPERYFDLPFDLDVLEDLYETLCILVENPEWEGENPGECWPRTTL